MAIVWMDGFDAYGPDNTDVTSLITSSGYTQWSGSFTPNPTTSSNTRDGIGFSMNPNAGGHNGYLCGIIRNFPLKYGLVVGFAYYTADNSFNAIMQFGYGDGRGFQFALCNIFANALGGITACVGLNEQLADPGTYIGAAQGSTIGISEPNILFPGTWQYIEIYYVPLVTGGTLQIKVDGRMVINNNATLPTSFNYHYPGTGIFLDFNWVNSVMFLNTNPNGQNQLIDDLYICDLLGGSFNNFLGDVAVRTVFPNADATPNSFSQVGGGAGHFTTIDEQTPDGDASYLTASASGSREMFALSTFPSDVIDVLAVAVNVRASKDTSGYAYYATEIEYSGTTLDGGTTTVSQAYQTYQTVFQTSADGSPWSTGKAQATAIGFKIP